MLVGSTFEVNDIQELHGRQLAGAIFCYRLLGDDVLTLPHLTNVYPVV